MGTWIVAVVLLILVGLIVYKLIQDKRNGKSSCGSACKSCANSEYCHSAKQKKSSK